MKLRQSLVILNIKSLRLEMGVEIKLQLVFSVAHELTFLLFVFFPCLIFFIWYAVGFVLPSPSTLLSTIT